MSPLPSRFGTLSLADLFPLRDGLTWRYETNLGETVSWMTVTGGGCLVVSESPHLTVRQFLRVTDEAVLLLEGESETLVTRDRRIYRPPMLRLPLRVRVGQCWSWEGEEILKDGEVMRSRVEGMIEGEETVRVPAGEFSCLRVKMTTNSSDGTESSSTQWLAPGVGVVKGAVEIKPGGFTGFIIRLLGMDRFTLELKEMSSKAP